jgi:hypothetical protein
VASPVSGPSAGPPHRIRTTRTIAEPCMRPRSERRSATRAHETNSSQQIPRTLWSRILTSVQIAESATPALGRGLRCGSAARPERHQQPDAEAYSLPASAKVISKLPPDRLPARVRRHHTRHQPFPHPHRGRPPRRRHGRHRDDGRSSAAPPHRDHSRWARGREREPTFSAR